MVDGEDDFRGAISFLYLFTWLLRGHFTKWSTFQLYFH